MQKITDYFKQAPLQQILFEFLDVIPIPILMSEEINPTTQHREHRFLNRAFIEQIGYTLEEIPDIAHWFKHAYPDPDYRQQVIDDWSLAVSESLAEGRTTAERTALIRCKNGHQRWFSVVVQLQAQTATNLQIVTFRDIHALKSNIDEYHHLSQTDQLTQLLNRRAGSQLLTAACTRFHRDNEPFSVIMCDIDDFKRINDHYGHAAGDEVLCQMAEALLKTSRKHDSIVRWGGEEFLLILPGTQLQEATLIAERLRQLIQAQTCLLDKQRVYLTMSFGCATVQAGQSETELLNMADQALYHAKNGGRNRVWSESTD